jgi:hypothetical protein
MDLRLDLPFCIGFCSLRRQQKAMHLIAKPYEERFFPSARSILEQFLRFAVTFDSVGEFSFQMEQW